MFLLRRIVLAWSALLCAVSPSLAFDPPGEPSLGVIDAGPDSAASAVYVADPLDDYGGGGIFDEVRLGGSTFLKGHVPDEEDGAFINGQVLFDPLWRGFENRYLDALLRPRPHLGGTVSFDDGTNQLFGGFTWTLPLGRFVFLEASFGGTIHDGELHRGPGDTDLDLGCRVLFRESAGLGLNLGPHWRVVAAVDHSSHASLCDDHNAGLSHVGASLGYRF